MEEEVEEEEEGDSSGLMSCLFFEVSEVGKRML